MSMPNVKDDSKESYAGTCIGQLNMEMVGWM